MATGELVRDVVGQRGTRTVVLDLQLVEPRTRRVRWSKQYEGNRDGTSHLVGEAAEGLRLALKPESAAVNTTTGLSTKNSEAELAFRRGQYYANRYNNRHLPTDFDLAFASLKQALELDPGSQRRPPRSTVFMLTGWKPVVPPGEAVVRMEEWARRAIAINPRSRKSLDRHSLCQNSTEPKARARKMQEGRLRWRAFGPQCSQCQTGLNSS